MAGRPGHQSRMGAALERLGHEVVPSTRSPGNATKSDPGVIARESITTSWMGNAGVGPE